MENDENKFGLKKTYKTNLKDAAWLIYAFLKKPKLYTIASHEAIGGTINKNIFYNGGSLIYNGGSLIYYGSMGWYCRNVEGGNYPKFFLALEDGEYNPDDVPKIPNSDILFYPKHTFTFNKKEFSETDVFDMLRNDQFALEGDSEIPKNQVIKFLGNKPLDPSRKKFNQYNCSFFENRNVLNPDVSDFLNIPNMVAIRYYFGFDDSDISHIQSNRIRIILIGVDKDGKNIAPENNLTVESNFLLQNSWPPPPPKRDT